MILHWNSILAKVLLRKRQAITFGQHVFFKKYFSEYPVHIRNKLLVHEQVHVNQYQRYGFVCFICLYLWQWIRYGYDNMPLENEARKAEDNV